MRSSRRSASRFSNSTYCRRRAAVSGRRVPTPSSAPYQGCAIITPRFESLGLARRSSRTPRHRGGAEEEGVHLRVSRAQRKIAPHGLR